jgi:hypothetical protein
MNVSGATAGQRPLSRFARVLGADQRSQMPDRPNILIAFSDDYVCSLMEYFSASHVTAFRSGGRLAVAAA